MGFFDWLRKRMSGPAPSSPNGQLWAKATAAQLEEYEPTDDLIAQFPSIPRDHLCLLIAGADTLQAKHGHDVVVALFTLCYGYQSGKVTVVRRDKTYFLYGSDP